MFKTTLLAATAALALTATPALAQTNEAFIGPRAELTVGFTDVENIDDRVNYGANVGFDLAATDRITLGADLDTNNVFDDNRTLGAGVRMGIAANENTLVFGRVGYENLDLGDDSLELEGLALGGGLQFRITDHSYATTEYRYTDFNHGIGSHGVRAGLGIRF